MGKILDRNTKGRITAAAWTLFTEQGYENTTIEDIINASGTSRGSFYHYFESKGDLFTSMTHILDEAYQKIADEMDESLTAIEKLLYTNREICKFIENRVSVEMLTRMYSNQLITRGEKRLLDRNRFYYRLLWQIFEEGQQSGVIRNDLTVNEMVKAFTTLERGILYDWCVCDGEYGLTDYSAKFMPMYLSVFLAQ